MNTIQKLRRFADLAAQLVDLGEDLVGEDGFSFGYIELARAGEFIDEIRDAVYATEMEVEEREGEIAKLERKIAKLKGITK